MAAGAVTALAATALGTATSAHATTKAASGLKVGFGKAAFTPGASLLPLDGFTAVHDDLNVRVLLVESGARHIALAVSDLTSISAEAVALMRDAITAASGIGAANIMVTVTHRFSAPHVQASSASAGAAAYVRNIVAATKFAVADAVKNLQDASVGYGSGRVDVNVNRNVLTADGYWLGVNEQLPSDKGVYVARFNDLADDALRHHCRPGQGADRRVQHRHRSPVLHRPVHGRDDDPWPAHQVPGSLRGLVSGRRSTTRPS